jgi:hypothetical protein
LKRALLAAFGLALAVPAAASAHVTVRPTRVETGEQTLEFTVPNEYFGPQSRSRVDEVVIKAPRGARIGQLQTKPGWSGTKSGQTATWTGGEIVYGRYDTFGLEVDVREGVSTLGFEVIERFAGPGSHSERYPVRLPVGASSSGSNGKGLAIAALIVALGAAGLAVAGFFLGLARWLRGAEGP